MTFDGEKEAIEAAIQAGENYGYGNVIAHLKQRWAENLMKKWDFTVDSAVKAADTSAYPPGHRFW